VAVIIEVPEGCPDTVKVAFRDDPMAVLVIQHYELKQLDVQLATWSIVTKKVGEMIEGKRSSTRVGSQCLAKH
jgi:hypothetical protein